MLPSFLWPVGCFHFSQAAMENCKKTKKNHTHTENSLLHFSLWVESFKVFIQRGHTSARDAFAGVFFVLAVTSLNPNWNVRRQRAAQNVLTAPCDSVGIYVESKAHLSFWYHSPAVCQCDGEECQFVSFMEIVFFSVAWRGIIETTGVFSHRRGAIHTVLVKMSLCPGSSHTNDFVAGGSAASTPCSARVPISIGPLLLAVVLQGLMWRNCHLASLSCRKLWIKSCALLIRLHSPGVETQNRGLVPSSGVVVWLVMS